MVKNQPAVKETWYQSLGQEDPLEKDLSAHPSILAWRILWTEEPGRLQSIEPQRVRRDLATNRHVYTLLLIKITLRLGFLVLFWHMEWKTIKYCTLKITKQTFSLVGFSFFKTSLTHFLLLIPLKDIFNLHV